MTLDTALGYESATMDEATANRIRDWMYRAYSIVPNPTITVKNPDNGKVFRIRHNGWGYGASRYVVVPRTKRTPEVPESEVIDWLMHLILLEGPPDAARQ